MYCQYYRDVLEDNESYLGFGYGRLPLYRLHYLIEFQHTSVMD